MQYLLPHIPFVLMNPTRFLCRALFLPFQVGFIGEHDLAGGSTPQVGPEMQVSHPTLERGGADGLDLEQHSSESMVANETECIIITRKFRTTKLRDR